MNEETEIIRALGRLEAKVDSLMLFQADIQHRVGSLERAWSKVLGAAAVVAALSSYIMTKIGVKP